MQNLGRLLEKRLPSNSSALNHCEALCQNVGVGFPSALQLCCFLLLQHALPLATGLSPGMGRAEGWCTCMTTMLPTAAAACAALGEGGSPCGFMRSHFPLLTSMMCTSLVAPASLMPALHLLSQKA